MFQRLYGRARGTVGAGLLGMRMMGIGMLGAGMLFTIAPAVQAQGAPPSAAPGGAAEKKQDERVNVFPEGEFDTTQLDGGLPKGWWTPDPTVVAVEQNGDDRYLTIHNNKADGAISIVNLLPLKPEWKKLLLSTRLASKNLKPGTGSTHRATVNLSFNDANKKTMKSVSTKINMLPNSDWKLIEQEVEIPAGAKFLVIRPGLFFMTGELGLDDVRVFVVN